MYKFNEVGEVKFVSAGYDHSMIINYKKELWAYGYNAVGQLGNGSKIKKLDALTILLGGGDFEQTPAKIMDEVDFVSTKYHHTLAIKSDGSLWAWGHNEFGQLGVGNTNSSSLPKMIMKDVVFASAGFSHSLAVKRDGSLWAWGKNDLGQIGVSSVIDCTKPVQIMEQVRLVSAGKDFSMAIKIDGSLWAWGINDRGQLGAGNFENRISPVCILQNVKDVVCDRSSSVALLENGVSFVWGYHGRDVEYTEKGIDKENQKSLLTPTQLMDNVKLLGTRTDKTYVVHNDGSLWISSWEGTEHKTLVLGKPITKFNHMKVKIACVSFGRGHFLAICEDGSFWSWGANNFGQLGMKEIYYADFPVKLLEGKQKLMELSAVSRERKMEEIVHLAFGKEHFGAIDKNHTLWIWGYNSNGQLGVGYITYYPYRPFPILENVIQLAVGDYFTFALKFDGTVWFWGYYDRQALFEGKNNLFHKPVKILDGVKSISTGDFLWYFSKYDGSVYQFSFDFRDTYYVNEDDLSEYLQERITCVHITNDAKRVIAGGYHNCGNAKAVIKSDNSLWFWGNDPRWNPEEKEEEDYENFDEDVLFKVMDNVDDICFGESHILILKRDGSVWAIGSNQFGQLGSGYGEYNIKFDFVYIMNDVVSISSMYHHNFAVKTDKSLWAWGNNQYGVLGDGTHTNRGRPTKVMNDVKLAFAGIENSIVVKENGSLLAWGKNDYGLFWDGTNKSRTIPVEMFQDSAKDLESKELELFYDIVKNYKENRETFITDKKKRLLSLWAMGGNKYGEVGDGTNISRKNPVFIMNDVISVYAASYSSFAIKKDGSLWFWGRNISDILGNGYNTVSYVPIKILENVKQVACGSNVVFVVKKDGSLWSWGQHNFGSEKYRQNKEIEKLMDGVQMVFTDGSHNYVLKTDGSLWGWGPNYNYSLGNNSKEGSYYPIEILSDVKSATIGNSKVYAIKNDDSLWIWGRNDAKKNAYFKVPTKIFDVVTMVTDSYAIFGDGCLVELFPQPGGPPKQIIDEVIIVEKGFPYYIIRKDGSLWEGQKKIAENVISVSDANFPGDTLLIIKYD